jgi:chromosome segregation ATPase
MDGRLYVRDNLLRALVKKWFAFQYVLQSGTQEEAQREHEQLVALVREYEFSVERGSEVASKMEKQLAGLAAATQEGREELERAKRRTAELKAGFKQAEQARSNHEEYEKLAELISRYPSREETVTIVNGLKHEIEALDEEKRELENRLAAKNGQFQLLLHAIRSLQAAPVHSQSQQQAGSAVAVAQASSGKEDQMEEGEL